MQLTDSLITVPNDVSEALRHSPRTIRLNGYFGAVVEVIRMPDGRGCLVYFPSVTPEELAGIPTVPAPPVEVLDALEALDWITSNTSASDSETVSRAQDAGAALRRKYVPGPWGKVPA